MVDASQLEEQAYWLGEGRTVASKKLATCGVRKVSISGGIDRGTHGIGGSAGFVLDQDGAQLMVLDDGRDDWREQQAVDAGFSDHGCHHRLEFLMIYRNAEARVTRIVADVTWGCTGANESVDKFLRDPSDHARAARVEPTSAVLEELRGDMAPKEAPALE